MESVLSDFMAFPSLTPFQTSLYLPPSTPPTQTPFSLSLPNSLFRLSSTWASKKRKSPPLSKRENPLVTHERSMSTWQVDWVISPHLTIKQWLEMSTEQCNIKCNISEQPQRRKTHADTVQHTRTITYFMSRYFLSRVLICVSYSLSSRWGTIAHCNILIFLFNFWMNHFLHGLLLSLLSPSCSISKSQIFSHRSFCFSSLILNCSSLCFLIEEVCIHTINKLLKITRLG